MGRGREDARRRAGGKKPQPPPIPLEPVDLLAGLAPDVELHADRVALEPDAAEKPAVTDAAQVGKLVRSGEATVRRLIRSATLRPAPAATDDVEPERAGVLPRTPDKPGE
jgi:hypothetical protein